MTDRGPSAHSLRRALEAAEDASPVQALESVTRELGLALGATDASFLIADLSGRALVRMAHIPLSDGGDLPEGSRRGRRHLAEETATALPFDGGPAEQAIRTQTVQVLAPTDAAAGSHDDAEPATWTVLAPVTERGETIGLLEMLLPEEPDARSIEEIARAAHLLAFVVIANRRHTDLFEWGQRTRPFTLSAEIQRRLLPSSFTCEAGSFTLSAWLEPAASIGGDTFDYSQARDVLHLSLTDAMGHGVASALTASLCLGSLRNSRRRGASLLDQASTCNAEMVAHAAGTESESYATGLLGRLDLVTGGLAMVNAGHVAPYLARAGTVTHVELVQDLPLGLFTDAVYRVTTIQLQPGDRLVLVTDGMLERNAADFSIVGGIGETRALHPREVVRALADRILEMTGHALADDATLLVLDWHGQHEDDRTADAGSDPARASAPMT
ncbi:MAG: serine/threonine protein phosphatase [Actinotalea sp.]|nr:serine/threonine protein phosphatase [Actinotalea sp.]